MLGGLLAYGSGSDDDDMHEDTQGQVTLMGEDESSPGGHDLSHLTGAAVAAVADIDTGAAPQQQGVPGPRPGSVAADQQQAAGTRGEDGQPAGAGGGDEQPPAEGEQQADPLAALPAEMRERPEGECYPDIQARVATWLHLQRTRGKYINQEIRKSRGYRNPEFFAKMVEHLEIEQYGSSLPPEVFDPRSLPPEDYLDALQREWAAEEERRKAARAAGHGRVEFHKSASNPSLVQPPLKPGLQPPGGIVTAAAIKAAQAAAAGAQQQASVGGLNTAAAVAAAQARAAALAAQLAQRRG